MQWAGSCWGGEGVMVRPASSDQCQWSPARHRAAVWCCWLQYWSAILLPSPTLAFPPPPPPAPVLGCVSVGEKNSDMVPGPGHGAGPPCSDAVMLYVTFQQLLLLLPRPAWRSYVDVSLCLSTRNICLLCRVWLLCVLLEGGSVFSINTLLLSAVNCRKWWISWQLLIKCYRGPTYTK